MEANSDTSTIQKVKKYIKDRPPIPILIICIFEFLGLLLLPSAFYNEFGLLYQIYLLIAGVLSITVIYTLWKMKKSGIFIYVGSYVLHNIVAMIVGNWMIGVIIIPLIGLILIGMGLKKFD